LHTRLAVARQVAAWLRSAPRALRPAVGWLAPPAHRILFACLRAASGSPIGPELRGRGAEHRHALEGRERWSHHRNCAT
jgi:hypothetical protein